MSNIWSQYDCYEEHATCNESYDDFRGSMKASVTLRTAWATRHQLVQDIIGNRRTWPKGEVAGVPPVAVTAGILPAPQIDAPGQVAGSISYSEALVNINYSSDVSAIELYSEELEPTAEFITLDHRWFRWGSGTGPAVKEEEAPGKLIRGLNFVRTDYKVNSLPPGLLGATGLVNSDVVTSSQLGINFDPETLLCAAPAVSHKYNSLGEHEMTVTKKLTFKAETWNKFFRSETGTWVYMYVAGSGTPYRPYPLYVFNGSVV